MAQRIITDFPKILRNNSHAAKLKEEGFVTFPFLKVAESEQLKEYYFSFQKEKPEHFYSSTHSKDFAFRKKTSDFIHSVVAPLLPAELENYKLLGGAFVVKPANGKGLLPPHQDWNLVDEEKTRSYNLWIPLTDVNVKNGAVFVLHGSHVKMHSQRGPRIPSIFNKVEKEVWNSLSPLPMKSGEALLYDHALLHASPENTTDKIRLGIVCGIMAERDSMQLYFKEGETINAYAATENFFMNEEPLNGPGSLKFIKSAGPEPAVLTAEQYQSVFLNQKIKENKPWFKKLFHKS